MEQNVRYGVLSTASVLKRFVKGMEAAGNGTVIAIASRSQEKAAKAAQELGIERNYGDYRQLLNDPDVEAVYIPVINSLHYSYARDALLAGKHVFMEKPFVLHAAEAKELSALAKKQGLFLTEAVKTPFLPVYAFVKEQIEQRNLGAIRYMEFHQSYTGGSYIAGWNRQKETGGGVLYGNEAYFFRMAEYFGGRIQSCTGIASYGESGVEEQVSLSVRLENNALAALGVSTNILFDNGLRIYLDNGRIVIPDYWKADTAIIFEEGTCTVKQTFPCEYEFQYELRHYNECIRRGLLESPVNPLEGTIRYIQFCEDLYAGWEGNR